MTNWSRRHDAWIARECEGLEVWVNAGDGAICDFQDDSIPHYLTDPAAAIRAAEAWRKKEPDADRTVNMHSAVERLGTPYRVDLHENYRVGEYFEWRTFEGESNVDYWPALAQALYRATGGPA